MSELTIEYTDPRNTVYHKAGLAGLYLSLLHLCPSQDNRILKWSLQKETLHIEPKTNDREFLDWLLTNTYGLTEEKQGVGVINCPALEFSSFERSHYHNGLLATFLQHPATHTYASEVVETEESITTEDSEVKIKTKHRPVETYNYRDLKPYKKKGLFSKKDGFLSEANITQWLLPGATEKHAALAGGKSRCTEKIEQFLVLLFLPLSCRFYRLRSKLRAEKARWAVVIPEFKGIAGLQTSLDNRVHLDVETCIKTNIEDATGTVFLETGEYCSTILGLEYGEVAWSRQVVVCKKVQIVPEDIENRSEIEIASSIPNKIIQSKKGSFIDCSFAKELIISNLARGDRWNANLTDLIKQQDFGGINRLLYESETIWNIAEEMRKFNSDLANTYSDAFLWQYYEQRVDLRNESRGFPNYDNLKSKLLFEIRNCRTQEEYIRFHRNFFGKPTWTKNPFIPIDQGFIGEFYDWSVENWQDCLSVAVMTVSAYRRPHDIPRIAEQLGLIKEDNTVKESASE